MKTNCLITGVTRGLGKCLSYELKKAGHHVIGVARNDLQLKEMQDQGTIDDYVVCDLGQPEQVDDLVRVVENRYDRIDILVLNAAIQNAYHILESTSYDGLLRKEMQVNFLSPVQLTCRLMPLLLRAKGRVVLISSVLKQAPKYHAPGYGASKAALSNWAENFRAQVTGEGLQVTEIIPGLIKTDMTQEAQESGKDPRMLANIIVKRFDREQIILPGARLATALFRLWPSLLKKKLLKRP